MIYEFSPRDDDGFGLRPARSGSVPPNAQPGNGIRVAASRDRSAECNRFGQPHSMFRLSLLD